MINDAKQYNIGDNNKKGKSNRVLLLTSFMPGTVNKAPCSSNVVSVERVIAAINTKIDIIPVLISLSSAPKDQQLMT